MSVEDYGRLVRDVLRCHKTVVLARHIQNIDFSLVWPPLPARRRARRR